MFMTNKQHHTIPYCLNPTANRKCHVWFYWNRYQIVRTIAKKLDSHSLMAHIMSRVTLHNIIVQLSGIGQHIPSTMMTLTLSSTQKLAGSKDDVPTDLRNRTKGSHNRLDPTTPNNPPPSPSLEASPKNWSPHNRSMTVENSINSDRECDKDNIYLSAITPTTASRPNHSRTTENLK